MTETLYEMTCRVMNNNIRRNPKGWALAVRSRMLPAVLLLIMRVSNV